MLGIALSSGSIRGIIEIGILQSLEEHGLEFDVVAGCSIGSLIGASYASGHSAEEIGALAESLDISHLFRFLDWEFSGGIMKGEKFAKEASRYLKKQRIRDFPRRYGAVATDISSGEPVFITEGLARNAIRASSCFPVVFKPFRYRGKDLIDGGVVDPLPLDLAFHLGAEKVIGVNVSLWNPIKGNGMVNVLSSIIPSFQKSIIEWQKRYYGDRVFVIDVDDSLRLREYLNIPKTIEYGRKIGEDKIHEIDRWLG